MSPKQLPAGKDQISVVLPSELLERVRNAVYWKPGTTLAGMVEAALVKLVDHMEKVNKGPYPSRPRELSAGRPLSGSRKK